MLSQLKPKSILVLDANAFISCSRLVQFGKKYRLVTTSTVIEELKDKKTKQYLQKLPYQIQQKHHNQKSLIFVKQFAKKTGDIGSLSDVDMELIALTHTLYQQSELKGKLRKEPPPIVQKVIEEDLNDDEEESDQSEGQVETHDQLANNQQSKQPTQSKQAQQQQWITVHNNKKKKEQAQDSDLSEDEGWITPDNYEKKMSEINTSYLQTKQSETIQTTGVEGKLHQQDDQKQQEQFQIALISADYAIQNVTTQMGIKLISLDGRVIASIRRFVWECYLCWKQHKVSQNKVKLCSGCGYNSLSKISYSLDTNGNAILHRKRGWKPNSGVQQWKQKKYDEQQKRKRHQHQRRTKKASIFQTA